MHKIWKLTLGVLLAGAVTASSSAMVPMLGYFLRTFPNLFGSPIERAISQIDQAVTERDAAKRASLLSDAKQLITSLKSLESELSAKDKEIRLEFDRLEEQKKTLLARAEALEKEKVELLRKQDGLETREKLLATGLAASLTTLLVALFAGIGKLPLLRVERKLKELEIEERQLKLSQLRSAQRSEA
jgi:hypothetical protein